MSAFWCTSIHFSIISSISTYLFWRIGWFFFVLSLFTFVFFSTKYWESLFFSLLWSIQNALPYYMNFSVIYFWVHVKNLTNNKENTIVINHARCFFRFIATNLMNDIYFIFHMRVCRWFSALHKQLSIDLPHSIFAFCNSIAYFPFECTSNSNVIRWHYINQRNHFRLKCCNWI